jgi:hypothetical protein
VRKRNIAGAFSPHLEDFTLYDGEDCALGTVRIFGVRHHVTFVKVHTVDGVQTATNDPHDRLSDILNGSEGPGETVQIPSLKGEWIVGVDPYRD